MFQKAIACIISAAICTAAMLSGMPVSSRQAQTTADPPASTEAGRQGGNSLNRYLSQQGSADRHAQPVRASATESFFAVTDLDYDSSTGLIRAVTSQSEDCTLLVSFIDQDDPEKMYHAEAKAAAGEYAETAFSADPARVPEYFTIRAQLVDRMGIPLSQSFLVNRFTREMQEILGKNVSDFDAEKVVDLDGDQTTNFIVLSEDTVKAETADNINTLVSADYDRNIYIFEHIDESIRSLEQGQYLYIQPTDTDIISTDIQEIVIEGDRATVTGSGDIGDMFDFVKMETVVSQTEYPAESDRQFLGASVQTVDNPDDLQEREDQFQALDPNAEFTEITKTLSFSTKIKSQKERFVMKPELTCKVTVRWNFYKSFRYSSMFVVGEAELKAKLHAEAAVKAPGEADPAQEKDDSEEKKDIFSSDDHLLNCMLWEAGVGEVHAASLIAFLDLELKLSAELDFSISKKFTKGFIYDSDNGVELIDFDTEPEIGDLSVEAGFSVEIKAGFELSILMGLAKASVSGGVSGEAKISTDNYTENPTYGKNVFSVADSGGAETVHSCEHCLKIPVELKVSIEVKVGVGFDLADKCGLLKKLNDGKKLSAGKLKLEYSAKYETDQIFGIRLPQFAAFFSYNSGGDYKGVHFSAQKAPAGVSADDLECPCKAYRVTFRIGFANAPAGTGAYLSIDGQSFPLTVAPSGELVLYAVPRTQNRKYDYAIYINGEQKASGNFCVTDAVVECSHTFDFTVKDDGSTEIVCGTGVFRAGPSLTTTTQTAAVQTEPVFDYADKLPAKYQVTQSSCYYALGPDITGFFSNDGVFTVIGSGDMFARPDVPESVRKQIRTVVFQDEDPENDLYINEIGTELFRDAELLEVVYMPARIRTIGEGAFRNCVSLKYLRYGGESDTTETFILPETLESVGKDAFSCCSSAAFGDLRIPVSVSAIGSHAFNECAGITALDVPGNGALTLGMSAFGNCKSLRKAVLGDGVKAIDAYLFGGSDAVEELTLPFYTVQYTDSMPSGISSFFASSEVAGMYEVYKLERFRSVVHGYVPESLTKITVTGGSEIPEGFFANMTGLRSVSVSESVSVIGNRAFSRCEALEDFVLPQQVTRIGEAAFAGCRAIPFGDLRIPESTVSVGTGAFTGCNGITSLTVPGNGETTLGINAFADCTSLRKAVIGDGVKAISPCVFTGCTGMEDLTIPFFAAEKGDSLPEGISAFFSAGRAAGMYEVYTLNRVNSTVRGYVPEALARGTVTGCDAVPEGFFANMTSLVSVTLSAETASVGQNAFRGCESLAEAHLLGENPDWDRVDITETGNEPLLRLVRRQHPEGYRPGDLNGDGQIDVSDVVLLARFVTADSTATVTDIGKLNADVNGDGNADLTDVTLILQYIAKIIRVFPVSA